MVRVFLLMISLFLALPVQAVTIKLQKAQVPFGEAIVIRIKTQEGEVLQKYLQAMPRQAWSKDFVIELHSNGQNRAAYYLYSYEPGQFQLAAGGIFKGAEVQVLPNSLIDVQWHSNSGERVFYKQAWSWDAQVKLNDPSLRVQLKGFIGSDIQSHPQGLKVDLPEQSLLAGDLKGRLRAWYHYSPQTESNTERVVDRALIYSPAVEVDYGERHPWKFFAKPVSVQLTSLPDFLPPQVLIGDIQFLSRPLPLWGQEGELLHWQWNLTGLQMNRAELQLALQQMLSTQPRNEQFEWFSPSVQFRQQDAGKVQIEIPIRLKQTGQISLPQWRWRYFDTGSGKLEVATPKSSPIWVLASWQLYLIGFLLLILVASVLVLIILGSLFYWQKWRLLQQLKTFGVFKKPETLWRQTEAWLRGERIGSWQQWQKATGVRQELVRELERTLYSQSDDKGDQEIGLLLTELKRELGKRSLNRELFFAYLRSAGKAFQAGIIQLLRLPKHRSSH